MRKAGKGDRDARKRADEDFDEFDMMTEEKNLNTSLSKKLGKTPDSIMKGKKGKGKGSPEKKGKKKNPWSDSDVSDVDGLKSFLFQNYLHIHFNHVYGKDQ